MKIPEIFVPDKNQDEKVRDIIQDRKKIRRIEDIESLACLPENIGNYALKGDITSIDKERWQWYFGKHITKDLSQAAMMTYMAPHTLVYTAVYLLEFKCKDDLDELYNNIGLEKEISQVEAVKTRCLKKDRYLVAIRVNKTDKDSLDVIGNFYVKNFKMEKL